MKILWLSNAVLSNNDGGETGTWLNAMAQRLIASGEVTLGNIAMGNVNRPTVNDCTPLQQWLVPTAPPGKSGLPSRRYVDYVLRTVEAFSPDLVHIWGVESWWGLLNSRGLLSQPVLLEMQGVKGVCSRVFGGGLTIQEQRSCRGPKELLLRRSIKKDGNKFAAWGPFENEIIRGCNHVATQTPWVKARVRAANTSCITYQTELMLRQQFYSATVWSPRARGPVIFCSAAYSMPYKGLHDVIRVVALLLQRIPNIRLRIAGAPQKQGLRQDGYMRWLNRLSVELGVVDCIDWLGALSAEKIVEEYQACSVFVMSSHIENCCTAMQEALYLGVPTVSAYAGGVPSLAAEEEAALYYSPGDEVMCAYQVERLLIDRDLAIHLSINARFSALERNKPDAVVENQLEIYRKVIL